MRRTLKVASGRECLHRVLVYLAAGLLCGNAIAAPLDESQSRPTLHVQGSALLDKPADQLQMAFSVVTQEETASAAASRNASLMTEVQNALRKAGIAKNELATLNFRIDPIYSQRSKLDSRSDWHPTIQAYRVSNRIRVTTADLTRAGEWIDAAIAAGANSVESIHFGLKDPRIYRDEIIRAATAHAIADAQSLASAASLDLIGILEIILDPGQPVVPIRQRLERVAFAQAAPTPIEPGAVKIRASVTVIYEVRPRN
jgi:hypothetical protein